MEDITKEIDELTKDIQEKLKLSGLILITKQKSPSFGVMLRAAVYDLFELIVKLDYLISKKRDLEKVNAKNK